MAKIIRNKYGIKNYWEDYKSQPLYFWGISLYIICEYLRPQQIYPLLDILPWAQTFLMLTLFSLLISKERINFTYSDLLLVTLFLIIILSSFYSDYSSYAFSKLDLYYSWIAVVILFHNSVNTKIRLGLVLSLLFLCCFKLSLFGAKSWVMRGFSFTSWGIQGPPGFFYNSGELSLLMVMLLGMTLPLSIYFYRNSNNIYLKLSFLIPLTAFMTILAASSRGAQLALFLQLIFYFIFINKLSTKRIFILCTLIYAGYILLPDEQKIRFQEMGDDKTSESRLVYWDAALDMMNNNKLLGIGHSAFTLEFHHKYKNTIDTSQFDFNFERIEVSHNTYLQIGSTLGYSGLLIYILILFRSYSLNRKCKSILSARNENNWMTVYCKGLDLSLIGYLIGSTFMSVAFYPYIYLQLMISQSIYNILSKNKSGYNS